MPLQKRRQLCETRSKPLFETPSQEEYEGKAGEPNLAEHITESAEQAHATLRQYPRCRQVNRLLQFSMPGRHD